MNESILFFATPLDFRQWLTAHHQDKQEQWVGFYKINSGKPSMTWPESVDEALCVGWIDGLRKGIDEVSYKIRFTPRKPGSIWSAVNIERVEHLTNQGRMQAEGQQAFEKRSTKKSVVYSYEQGDLKLDDASEQQFRANSVAWDFFMKQAESYRKKLIWWVISAKKEETRLKRLSQLIAVSTEGKRM